VIYVSAGGGLVEPYCKNRPSARLVLRKFLGTFGAMAMSRKPRGPYAKTSARRQGIVGAAVEVFSSAGYHKGSLREVAGKVGLSQAGLLHHFPSKEHLLKAVLDWRDDASAELIGTPLPDGIDLLRGLVLLAEYNANTPELVELQVVLSAEGTSADHPLHAYLVDRYAFLFDLVLGAFEHAEAHGQLRPDVNRHSAARTLIALMDGLQVQWLLQPENVDMPADLRKYLQTLVTVDM
jgi:AcrR family transcriptional regulator